jgi:hypothetical protein
MFLGKYYLAPSVSNKGLIAIRIDLWHTCGLLNWRWRVHFHSTRGYIYIVFIQFHFSLVLQFHIFRVVQAPSEEASGLPCWFSAIRSNNGKWKSSTVLDLIKLSWAEKPTIFFVRRLSTEMDHYVTWSNASDWWMRTKNWYYTSWSIPSGFNTIQPDGYWQSNITLDLTKFLVGSGPKKNSNFSTRSVYTIPGWVRARNGFFCSDLLPSAMAFFGTAWVYTWLMTAEVWAYNPFSDVSQPHIVVYMLFCLHMTFGNISRPSCCT